MTNLDDEGWDKRAEKMRNKGIILNGLLPNSTQVIAIMDELFRAFKNLLQQPTHGHYSRKIKKDTK